MLGGAHHYRILGVEFFGNTYFCGKMGEINKWTTTTTTSSPYPNEKKMKLPVSLVK